jgi:hypothetical protein
MKNKGLGELTRKRAKLAAVPEICLKKQGGFTE